MIKFFMGLFLGILLGGAAYHQGIQSVQQPEKLCNLVADHPRKGTFEHEVKRTD